MAKKLLLADDSITIQRVVGITFANEDFEITTVDNGEDAVQKAKEIGPDIVLADVIMPKLNGYEVCRTIKADARLKNTPVLLLAGTFEAFDENRAREVGADGHITKPFESQALIDRVKQMLSGAPAAAAAPQPHPPVAPRPVAPPAAPRPVAPPVAPRPITPPVAPRPIPTPVSPPVRPVPPPAAAVPPATMNAGFAPPVTPRPVPTPTPTPFAPPPVAQPMPPPQVPRPFAPPPAAVPTPPSTFAPMVTPPPVAPPTPKPFAPKPIEPAPVPVPREQPSMPSPFDLEPAEPAEEVPLSTEKFEPAPAEPLSPMAFSEPPAFTPSEPKRPAFSFEPASPQSFESAPPPALEQPPLEPAPLEPEPVESQGAGFGDFGTVPTDPQMETQPGTLADLTEAAAPPADGAEMPAVDIDEEGMTEEPPPLAPMHEFIPPPSVGHVKESPKEEKAPARFEEEIATQPPRPAAPVAAPAAVSSLPPEELQKLAREAIEKAVWEIVPQLAETILREEIEKLVQKKLAE